MTIKELQAKLAQYPDDAVVTYMSDEGRFRAVMTVINAHDMAEGGVVSVVLSRFPTTRRRWKKTNTVVALCG